jgi:hypothetical protein
VGISPDRNQPKWDGSPQNLGAMVDAGSDLGAGLAGSMNGIVGGIGSAIMNGLGGILGGGIFAPVEEAAEEIKNGQDSIKDELELLWGVSGYCFSYMSRNVNVEWSGNNWRTLPFDTQLGPSKEASVQDGKLKLTGKGLWLVMMKGSVRPTNYGGSTLLQSSTKIRRPNGELWHESVAYSGSAGSGGIIGNQTAGGILDVFPVVVADEGCTIETEAYSGAWRWWDGGYRKSMLAAIRFSTDTENLGDADVPDETEEEAKG